MNVLVTGGAGFVGSHTIRKLLERGDKVVCIDDFNGFNNPKIKEDRIRDFPVDDFKLFRADITDFQMLQNIFEYNDIEAIIHLAARAGVRNSIEDPRLYSEVNVAGTIHLLELAKKHAINHFVFASSSSVYGGNKKVPFSEEDAVDYPISPYATTKRAGELSCHTYHHLFGMNIACLRFFTVYGPWGRMDMAPYKFTDLIAKGQSIEMYGDGTSERDYTYIDDVVSGVLAALELVQKNEPVFEIFNLGNSQTVPLKKFISLISKNLGQEAKIIKKPMQPGDMKITYADITKAKKLLGYDPQTSIEEGLQNLVKWYQQEAFKKY
ncbi:GDP-mannose 4,6-dehydratase [Patescibacteria group bacterium]|nr:GDP-mannose 4,6-dehydratase [Patescibacteria group bacterium]